MKNPCKQALIATFVSLAVLLPNLVAAESTFVTAPSPTVLTTDARVDFRITIPRVLRFQVGSPGAGAANIDLIDIAPSAAVLGDGTDVAANGGDLGGGTVTVNVLSNVGDVTISHDTNGASLDDGGGNLISYAEILTAETGNVIPPTLGGAGSTVIAAVGGLVNESGTWTYTYDNTAIYPSGVYGTATNGGRVTYTATSP